MFIWKYHDMNPEVVSLLQDLFKRYVPEYFFTIETPLHFTHPSTIPPFTFEGVTFSEFRIVCIEPESTGVIHTDQQYPTWGTRLALNIPLANCDQSTTRFWRCTPSSEKESQIAPTQNSYKSWQKEECEYLTEYCLTRPVLIDTEVPHCIENFGSKRRVSISIRFKEDPWHWL
ncbi:hypothetical protein EBT25_00970 [bacterium]|jgi:hypothetical protein|nr:hypothetical protein [bacterium]